jgi:hypothetical protein
VTPSRDGAILEEGGGAPRFRSRGSRDRGRAAEARRCGRGQRGKCERQQEQRRQGTSINTRRRSGGRRIRNGRRRRLFFEGDRAPGAKGKRIGVRWLVAVGEHFIVKCTSIRTYI